MIHNCYDSVTQFCVNKVFYLDNQFRGIVERMVNAPSWTLKSWKDMIEGQLSGWTMYIPGINNTDDVKLAKKFKGLHLFKCISSFNLFI